MLSLAKAKQRAEGAYQNLVTAKTIMIIIIIYAGCLDLHVFRSLTAHCRVTTGTKRREDTSPILISERKAVHSVSMGELANAS